MPVMTTEVRVQAGTQNNYTTAATPTVLLRGMTDLTLRPANEAEVLGDMTLGLAGGDTGVVYGIGAEGSMSGWASYQHLAYFFDNLFGQATPGSSPGYARQYAAPINTAPAPRILSLVKGDGTVGAYQMVGALLSSFTLRFEQRATTEMSGDFIGVKLQADTLESLTVPVVHPILPNHLGAFTLDTWAGTMGTTSLANCIVRFAEFNFEPDRAGRACFGSLSADQYVERPWNGSLTLGLEFNSTTKSVVDAIIGGTLTQRQIQMTATDGTRTLLLQFAGTVTEDVEIFGDDDGVVTVDVTFERTYHPTFANWFKATLTAQTETLA